VRCFFFPICILSIASTLPNFMRKWAKSWKNKDVGLMYIAWKVSKAFRDRKSWFIISGKSRTTEGTSTGKTLQERFHEIIQMGLTEMHVCIWNFWKNPLLLCFLPFWESFWWFSIIFHTNVLAFLHWLHTHERPYFKHL